jgi:antirestriction protein ArdC
MGLPADIPQHASYIQSWIKKLKDDKREIFRAAADAQRIADFALSFHPEYAATMKAERDPTPDLSSFPRPATPYSEARPG